MEDPLNIGIKDLKNGFIRTCDNPNTLFIYDSFHILRMLRFAVKYQFVIDDESLNEIDKNKKIYQDNLLKKIAKERINKELTSFFCSMNPSFAIYTLYKFGLLEYALQLKSYKINNSLINDKNILNCVNIFIIGKICFDRYKSYFEGENFDDIYKCCYYSILLTRNFTNKNNNLARTITVNVLKEKAKIIYRIIKYFDEFNNFISKNEYNRLSVGILLRKIFVINISKIILISVSNQYVMNINSSNVLDKIEDNSLDIIFHKYFEFYKYIQKENLEKINELKSIVNGKEIKNIFPGLNDKYIGEIIEYLIYKQIEMKNNLSKNDALNAIKLKMKELKIELDTDNKK